MWKLQVIFSLLILCGSLATSEKNKKFPDGFKFGASTAAFQVEGGWNEGGKTDSYMDLLYNEMAIAIDGNNAKVACDSYHKWQEDVALLKEIGFDFYRFSISWNRILPNATDDYINQEGVDYYLNIFKALKANNIEPKVTIFHYDIPMQLQNKGGWLNPEIVDYFGNYTRVVYRLFGDYVKYWITINEPKEVCKNGMGLGNDPFINGEGAYICARHNILAHARAYHIYHDEFEATQHGKVSLAMNSEFYEPYDPNSAADLEATERQLQFEIDWFPNCFYKGDWPEQMKTRVAERSQIEGYNKSRLPEWSEEEKKYITGTLDYHALNTYSTYLVKEAEEAPTNAEASFKNDERVQDITGTGTNWTCSPVDTTHCIRPEGIRGHIDRINKLYHPKEIIITENGWTDEGQVEDPLRIQFLREYLGAVLDSIYEDNAPVTAYSVWSLLDNFEWYYGFSRRYGIVNVDFNSPNRTRTLKQSAYWYQNLTSTRYLN